MSRSKWKVDYVNFKIFNILVFLNKKKDLFIFDRSSIILDEFVGLTFFVYTGRRFTKVSITSDMVGFKFGEFSFTRKMSKFLHINANLKKKKK